MKILKPPLSSSPLPPYPPSRYCSVQGLCQSAPTCPAGQYLDVSFQPVSGVFSSGSRSGLSSGAIGGYGSASGGAPAMRCVPCPAGRYGNKLFGFITSLSKFLLIVHFPFLFIYLFIYIYIFIPTPLLPLPRFLTVPPSHPPYFDSSSGASAGLVGAQCSGLCAAGYYCSGGSTSATQHSCGHSG